VISSVWHFHAVPAPAMAKVGICLLVANQEPRERNRAVFDSRCAVTGRCVV